MYNLLLKTVPLSLIRHNDLPCYVGEGFGGEPVEKWPIYSFFKQYAAGNEKKALEEFVAWYRDQISKYHNVPKEQGGMYRGSLYNLIVERCGEVRLHGNDACSDNAIRERIKQRFELLEHIRKNGFDPTRERIDVVRKGGALFLQGGHHRAAILKALGADHLPGVLVFPNQYTYNLFKLLRNIRYGHIQK